MNPLVSIIVPVYKVEEYLDECVVSLVNQTYNNLEIILVDDGSPDNCPQICDDWAKRDARIQVIHKQNGGLSDARNVALDIITGKYLIFVDSDDVIAFDLVETYLNIAEKECVDAVLGEKYVSFHDGDSLEELSDFGYDVMRAEDLLVNIFTKSSRWEAWNTLFLAEKFKNNRFRVGFLYEDYDLIPRVMLQLNFVALSHSAKYFYRLRSNSIMRNGDVVKTDLAVIADENIKLIKKSQIKLHNKAIIIFGILAEVSSRIKYCKNNDIVCSSKDFVKMGKMLVLKNVISIIFAKTAVRRKMILFYETFI